MDCADGDLCVRSWAVVAGEVVGEESQGVRQSRSLYFEEFFLSIGFNSLELVEHRLILKPPYVSERLALHPGERARNAKGRRDGSLGGRR